MWKNWLTTFFSIPFRLRNIILQFYISQKLCALLIDFLELLIRVRAVRTSSAGERWAVFCIGVPRILFLFERGANYNHDIWAVLSLWFSLLSRQTRRLTNAVYEQIATVMILRC